MLAAELDSRYGRHYDVVVAGSRLDAIASLRDNTAAVDIALVLAERHEDDAQLLAATRSRHPHAKRALLIGWNEHRSAREEIIQLLRSGGADYYVGEAGRVT